MATDDQQAKEAVISTSKFSQSEQKVRAWLTHWNALYHYDKDQIEVRGRKWAFNTLLDRIYLDLEQYGTGEKRIRAALSIWIDEQQEVVLNDLRASLLETEHKYSAQQCAEALSAWVDSVLSEGHELSFDVLRHWFWMVKRKLWGRPIDNPLCPVFQGASRGGKSTEARRLISALKPAIRELKVSEVSDDRSWQLLSRNYVVYMDEMAGAKAADIDTLKYLITANHLTQRIFHSQRHTYLPMVASLLGSSNPRVADIIRDETSGARYWELRCKDVLNWERLAKIPVEALWASVSAAEPSPLQGNALKEVLRLQDHKIRQRPSTELWVEDIELKPGETWISSTILYYAYKTWCKQNGDSALTANLLGRFLGGLGFVRARKNGGSRTRGWLVDEKCAESIRNMSR